MAQKTNPVSLRLKLNRRFDSFWWSSLYYSRLFDKDLAVRKHFDDLLRQTKKRTLARIGYTASPKAQKIFLYWVRPSKIEKKDTPSFWRRRYQNVKKARENPIYSFPTQGSSLLKLSSTHNNLKTREKARLLRLLGLIFSSTLIDPKSKKDVYLKLVEKLKAKNELSSSSKFYSQSDLQRAFRHLKDLKDDPIRGKKLKSKKTFSSNTAEMKRVNLRGAAGKKLIESIKRSFREGIQSNVRNSFQMDSSISPCILKTPYFSAHALTQHIKTQLRRRIFFKRIFGSIKRESHVLFKQKLIKGIRVLVSGRLGRPEKAKKASLYIGRTSLNTFNQQIDYYSDSALTKYGQVGIKVWISF